MIHVTTHAICRYQERVANLPDAQVVAILSGPAVKTAAAFGAPFVRLGTGQRLVIQNNCVVTVLPRDHRTGAMDRRREKQA